MHVSRLITWSLLTLEHQTWSNDQSQHDLSWWCQFIDYLKFETRPSSLKIWVRWKLRLGRGAPVFPVIIVETLSKFFFLPLQCWFPRRLYPNKHVKPTLREGVGSAIRVFMKGPSSSRGFRQCVNNYERDCGSRRDVVRLTDHRVLTEFIVDVRNHTQPCIRIGLRNKVYFGSN